MDHITILNYQGSKKNLIDFIHESLTPYLTPNDVLLDIFSGTCSVGYSYKRTNTVYANDAEKYGKVIASALLGPKCTIKLSQFRKDYENNVSVLASHYKKLIAEEERLIADRNESGLAEFYGKIPTIWNSKSPKVKGTDYSLFCTYYSASYFGLKQSIDIDSIRFAIEKVSNEDQKNILFACLMYAMKECIFSKDGHMAQPLDLVKNSGRLLKQREKSIYSAFEIKIADFTGVGFIDNNSEDNRTFNYDFEELIKLPEIKDNVTAIYADPPYTDMQYSRYYHLLNTMIDYEYAEPTSAHGKVTKGLYLDNRFQSQLSKKSTCLDSLEDLIKFSFENNKLLVFSFGYPRDTEKQKTDRYVMDIKDLVEACKKQYGVERVHVATMNYEHSNNRNSEAKSVIEYLVICERTQNGN